MPHSFVRLPMLHLLFLAIGLIAAATANAQNPIQWKAGPLAPRPTTSVPPADLLTSGVSRHVVVQFTEIPSQDIRDDLAVHGLRLQSYLGDNAYFAAVQPARGSASTVAGVAAAYEIIPAWKAHPMLLKREYPEYAVFFASGASAKQNAEDGSKDAPTIAVYALFHPDVELTTEAVAVVESVGGEVRDYMISINGLVAWIPLANLTAFIAHDSVQWVEPPLPPMQETNNSNRVITQVDAVNASPYNLTGDGIAVMVYDGGTADASHPDFDGRLTARDSSGLSDHATHVSGTIGGSGANSVNHGGTVNQWRGMAPEVEIESFGFEYDGTGQFLYTNPGDLEADYTNAISNFDAVIANNSIGTNVAPNGFPCVWEGDYGATSQLIDAIVAGSLGAPMRIIWAAGNERGPGTCGTTYNTTAPPAGAKNHITVGAMNSNNDTVTSFTSWGPTDDGRLKPDISGPGCQNTDDGGVTSTVPGGGYDVFCGTSMACPTVTGICALILEDFMAQYPGDPLPRNSTLKVLLAQNAQDLGNVGPDFQTGYGSVRAQATIDFLRGGQFFEDQITNGSTLAYSVTVPVGAASLKVTMAWDDPPGAVNTIPELVNDLDLVLVAPDGVTFHYPWTLDPASPATPAVRTQADHRNNLEQVRVDSPTSGVWEVRVIGFGVPQGPQVFSIAASSPITMCTSAGTIELDALHYACSSTATIQVVDCDLNTNAGAIDIHNVTITSTTEPAGESVTLTETDINSGQFVGSIVLDTTNAAGILQITAGDTVEAAYDDVDNGSGPATVVAQAGVDCAAPQISGVGTSDITANSMHVIASTDEPTRVTVHYGTACGAPTDSKSETGFGTSHDILLSTLQNDTTIYFVIEAEDLAGNSVVADNGGVCFSATTLEQPDYFTELFVVENDLSGLTLTFIPGSADGYTACSEPAASFPTDPTGGTPISLADDDYGFVTPAGGDVIIYGAAFSSFYVGSNGYITFTTGDTDYTESLDEHFAIPRISALFDDLNPSTGGSVSWKEVGDHVAVTFLNVPEYGVGNSNSFQFRLYFDGRIGITWLDLSATDGIAGLSQGLGLPIGFVESDLSGYDGCGQLTISGTVTYNGAGLSDVSMVGLPGAPVTNPNGFYSAAVPSGWSGVVTPSPAGNHDIVPPSRTYTAVAQDLTDEDYLAFDPGQKLVNEDLEGNPGLFAPDFANPGLWHLSSACQASDPAGHSPSSAFFYGIDAQCAFDAGATSGSLSAPPVDFAGATVAALQFSYSLYTEGDPVNYDIATVKVTPNGGPPVIVASNNPALGVPLLHDPSSGWETIAIDLSPFVGGPVQIAFEFDTVDGIANNFAGFYVDDIMIYGDVGTVPVTGRILVDAANNSGTEDGLTWATAYDTVQEGLYAAVGAGVTQVWVRFGTYDEARTSDLFGVDSGSVIVPEGIALLGGFDGSESFAIERDPLANPTVIDGATSRGGQPAYHVVFTSAHATIDGFTITGGSAHGAAPGSFELHNVGGGIVVYGGDATLRNIFYNANDADYGGALAVVSGNAVVQASSFVGNGATSGSGSVFSFDSTLAVSNCVFDGNTGNYSGGVEIWSNSPTFDHCFFTNNSGVYGGAVFAWNSTPIFNDCQFIGNTATLGAGAAFNYEASAIFNRCLMDQNQGVYGGTLSNWSCAPALSNCQITNSVGYLGGAAFNISSTPDILNCTIANNTSSTSGGALYDIDSAPTITNSILWNNTPNEIGESGTGTATVNFSIIQGNWAGTSNLDQDPLFVAPPDFALQLGSPAVDSADAGTAPPEDILGIPRPQGAGPDRGAYESH